MTVGTQTLLLQDGLRITVGHAADQVTRELVGSWVLAWDGMVEEMDAAVADLLTVGDGAWPTRGQINRATRAQKALAAAQRSLADLADETHVKVIDASGRAIGLAVEQTPHIIASQFPPGQDRGVLAAAFDRVSPEAINAVVRRTAGQVTALTRPLSAEATDAMKRTLIRGVAVGENPRVAASQMLARLEGEFNGGLTRALTIARTEILDAHRAGAMAAQNANTDVLAGWQWISACDKRTCPSCFARHGNQYPLEEPGPDDHQQGRCVRMPVTKSWKDLGFNIEEPPSLVVSGPDAFTRLPERDQLAVMGRQRLDAVQSGRVSWDDLSVKRTTDGWRDSYGVRPVKDLLRA